MTNTAALLLILTVALTAGWYLTRSIPMSATELCRVCIIRPATHAGLCEGCRPWHADPPTWHTTTKGTPA